VAFKYRWYYSNGSWHGSWDWRIELRGRSLDEFQELSAFLSEASFKPHGSDFWQWLWDKTDTFSVKKMSLIIQKKLSGVAAGVKFHWNSLVPSKVNIFVWRLLNSGLPVRRNLAKRRVYLATDLCVMCSEHQGTEEHCFLHCPMIRSVWRKVWAWWNVSMPCFSSLEDLKKLLSGGNDRLTLQATCMVLLWLIWKKRNHILFADVVDVKGFKEEDIFPATQSLTLLWFSNRTPNLNLNWDSWAQNPFSSGGHLDSLGSVDFIMVEGLARLFVGFRFRGRFPVGWVFLSFILALYCLFLAPR